jgi:RHS repeat-associated protein
MTYDSGNRLQSFNGQSVTSDSDGNMTFGPLGGNFEQFSYDHKNNLTRAGDVFYSYNSEDQLTGFLQDGNSTKFIISPSGDLPQIVQKKAPDDSITRYIYGVGLAYEVTGSQIKVYHFDHRGSTVAFTNGSGSVVGTVAYGPFGEIVRRSGDTDSPFLYHGLFGVLTGPNGMNYMRYRWYSPQIKRFVNADAHYGDIALPHSLNRYAFTGNNPINRVDPGGEFWNIIGGAIIGGLVSAVIKIASDAISGRKVDFTSGDYWAEIGGAFVSGAATGACIGSGVGIAAGALCGAAGSSLGYLTTAGLKGDQVDPGQLAFEAGVGAAGGALSAGAGRFLRFGPRTSVGNRFSQFRHGFRAKNPTNFKLGLLARDKAVMASDEYLITNILPKAGFKKLIGTSVGKEVAKATARRVFTPTFGALAGGSLAVKFGGRIAGNILFNSQSGGVAGGGSDNLDIEEDGWMGVSKGNKSTYGEYIHWQLYINTLQAAGRPIPNNPNNVLATF